MMTFFFYYLNKQHIINKSNIYLNLIYELNYQDNLFQKIRTNFHGISNFINNNLFKKYKMKYL